jgi:hypothetical protein
MAFYFIVIIFLSEFCKPLFWTSLFIGSGRGLWEQVHGQKGPCPEQNLENFNVQRLETETSSIYWALIE